MFTCVVYPNRARDNELDLAGAALKTQRHVMSDTPELSAILDNVISTPTSPALHKASSTVLSDRITLSERRSRRTKDIRFKGSDDTCPSGPVGVRHRREAR